VKKKRSRKKGRPQKKRILSLFFIIIILFVVIYNPLTAMLLTTYTAKQNNIDTKLFYRMISTESSFFTLAYSKKGAIGLGQVRATTAKYISPEYPKVALWFPPTNLQISADYLNYLLKKYRGNKSLALAAYNWGETNVDKKLKEMGITVEPERNYRDLFVRVPETYSFIGKILKV